MHHYLDRCLSCIEGATAGLTETQGRRKDGGRWSAAEVVEHLDRGYTATARGLERCLAADKPLLTPGTLSNRFWTGVVVSLGYFPRGREAPERVVPVGNMSLAEAVDSARRSLRVLDLAAMGASGRFGRAKVMNHPVLGPLTVDQWRRFHWIHTRHHRRQIEALRRHV